MDPFNLSNCSDEGAVREAKLMDFFDEMAKRILGTSIVQICRDTFGIPQLDQKTDQIQIEFCRSPLLIRSTISQFGPPIKTVLKGLSEESASKLVVAYFDEFVAAFIRPLYPERRYELSLSYAPRPAPQSS